LASDRFTLAIKNGLIHDGTGTPPFRADVGIRGDAITFIGDVVDADQVIDATGLIVAPGFIDTHGHSEFTMLAAPEAHGKLMQGITTEVNGNCGLSAGPMRGPVKERREADQQEYAIAERWDTLGEHFRILEARGPAINYATLSGHGNIRASVMGYEDRTPTEGEIDEMKELLLQSLSEGAIGLSTGLIYPPGVYSEAREIEALASAGVSATEGHFIYASHMRSEGDGLLESIEETLDVGRHTGSPVHVSHIKTAGRANWDKARAVIEMIENARAEGVRATADRYPYIAAATDLDSVLPAWMYEGGAEAELRRLSDPAVLQRLREQSAAWPDSLDAVRVSDVSTTANKWAEGLTIPEVAARWAVEPFDALIRLLREENLRVGAIFHSMCQENLKAFLSLPWCMVGTDSSVRSFEGVTRRGKPHPRGFGGMPRYLRMAMAGDLGDNVKGDALAQVISRITSLPARTFGLELRGRLEKGFMADIAVFDPGRLCDMADFEDPFRPPSGMEHVVVNGTPAVLDGRPTGKMPGRVLRHGRKA
jgi:N-acyl-D-amino-acid deacylase